MICNRVVKYINLHEKGSIGLGERVIEVLEIDASAGIWDVLGILWDGVWLREHQEPVERLDWRGQCMRSEIPQSNVWELPFLVFPENSYAALEQNRNDFIMKDQKAHP